jgi:hypothetical protein
LPLIPLLLLKAATAAAAATLAFRPNDAAIV